MTDLRHTDINDFKEDFGFMLFSTPALKVGFDLFTMSLGCNINRLLGRVRLDAPAGKGNELEFNMTLMYYFHLVAKDPHRERSCSRGLELFLYSFFCPTNQIDSFILNEEVELSLFSYSIL